ncbi:hypothetical protein Q7689_11320 [Nocardiopsis tropica]|uniref:hypothetical protein n=1 Tax=Nocardiopsis tropica TaxID=109330 RepID=UPI002E87A2BF|nr:hypothetical protein [Nocardiopsis tropica]
MSRPKDIGTTAETAVVRYLAAHGWPAAERRALTGALDCGDVSGTPGICWEVKGGRTAETVGDGLLGDWLEETERERLNAGADLGILVTKRTGYGPARAASWWAHADMVTWMSLCRGRIPLADTLFSEPVRMRLSALVPLLHAAGYGTPSTAVPAVEVVA